MKLVFLIIAAFGLVIYFFREFIPWIDPSAILFGSIFFFFLGLVSGYRKRTKNNDVLDDDFIDHV